MPGNGEGIATFHHPKATVHDITQTPRQHLMRRAGQKIVAMDM
jgi:hypothetical protein